MKKLYLFRDETSDYFLGTSTQTKKYNLFKLPDEMNLMDRLAYAFNSDQAENWLDWFLTKGAKTDLVAEELLPELPYIQMKIICFTEAK